ncbi:dTDP-glucose 4,6-dehydratase [Parasutterella excrementihominis]|uniref:dTDP-glucose 4,6-dehydratase n=1 Tax=Parasutterella excrementihominis TaxID=487175 RepID=UPI0026653BF1|nr:dTDP-glucose 4,6-dehydratase [Parasutterella excrementihominis]
MTSTFLVTGGAGFIGSCFVLRQVQTGMKVINLDKLTYSGNLENLEQIQNDRNHVFVRGDIGDEKLVSELLEKYQPDAVINFAAESHVDRSILDPDVFVKTNVLGTEILLRVVKDWWKNLEVEKKDKFRFHHISTDEVFGTLSMDDPAFTEETPFAPNSPYSASKAGSDHFVRAYHETYGLPTVITNCSNNYGPRQFPEKLIPLMTLNALAGKPLPIYGTGENIRDWLHVEDHCDAIYEVLTKGRAGQTYNIGGRAERNNLFIVNKICEILDEIKPRSDGKSYKEQITFVKDRLGHDLRYAINCSKIEKELGWKPKHNFEDGLKETIQWYLNNEDWVKNIQSGEYQKWIEKNYKERQ